MSVSSVVNRGVFECGVAVRTTTIVDSVVRSLFDALIERRKFANCLVVDTFGVPAEGLTISSGPARVRAVSCNICRSGHCRKGIYGTANQSIDDPFDHLTVIPKWPAPHTIEHGNNGSTTFHCASVKTASQSHQTH
jgi:hypothetical protein